MPYRHIDIPPGLPDEVAEAVRNADMYLHDVYGMFQLPVDGVVEGGGCTFSIALILLCVIDGISCHVYPTRLVTKQEPRFKKLVRDKLYPNVVCEAGIGRNEFANQLYLELRNPLVHELGQDKITRARRDGHDEPNIGKWGRIPAGKRQIDDVDGMDVWNADWWVMYEEMNAENERCIKLSAAALYWAVKRMIGQLVTDADAMAAAKACHDALRALESES